MFNTPDYDHNFDPFDVLPGGAVAELKFQGYYESGDDESANRSGPQYLLRPELWGLAREVDALSKHVGDQIETQIPKSQFDAVATAVKKSLSRLRAASN